MKNLLRKRISTVLLVVACFCCSFPAGASAQEIHATQIVEKTVISAQSQAIQPRADIIETKYRVYSGIFQRRRWNVTRGYWVDPYWMNC